jgi:hypothetical protein
MQREGEEERKREEVSMHMKGKGEKKLTLLSPSALFLSWYSSAIARRVSELILAMLKPSLRSSASCHSHHTTA